MTAPARARAAPVLRVLAVRVPLAVVLALVVVSLVFLALSLLSGDAATQLLGTDATPARVAGLRHELGLDRPVWLRWLEWLGGLTHGDLGRSLVGGAPVSELLTPRIGASAVFALCAGVLVVTLGVGLGVLAGLREGGAVDRVVSVAALVAVSLPEFVTASVLVLVLAAWTGLLPAVSLPPVGGGVLDEPSVLVLPVLTVTLLGTAFVARLSRAVVADQAVAAHVEAATLDGLPRARVVRRHLLPGALAPIALALAAVVPYLVGGSVVVEQVFGYPGLGQLLVSSVSTRDAPVIAGTVLVLTAVTAGAYLVADVVARIADPRTWSA